MYSNNQWSFNPAVYQNIPYEQVDWASLAQQWIKMKETAPTTSQGPAPPPAPVISKSTDAPVPTPTAVSSQISNDIEGGEAPMDMDTKDDEVTTPTVAAAATTGPWNQWGNWQSQWGWGWSGNSGSVPSTENTPSATSNVDSKVKSTNNDSIAALNDVRNFPLVGNTATTTQVSSTFNYNNTGGTVIPPIIPKSNYAFNNAFPAGGSKNSDNWHKAGKSSNRHAPQKSIPPEPFPVMDAAKKKQLPAWIREGLTKMEREKQKKMERERMVHEKHVTDQMKLDYNEPEPAPTPAYVEEPQPRDPPAAMPDYSRRYSPEPSPAPSSRYQKRRSPSIPRQRSKEPQALRKTKDQIMEESMLKVRRILTEILLEATEKQVHLIAKEEHRRYRASASAPQIRKSNALTSLTGNLGLDVYDSEDNSSDGDRDRDDDIDSDEELKMVIEKKKRDFTLVEDEIERMIEDQETRERLISQRDAKDEGDVDDEDSADDEEDEPKARSSRDKDIGGPMPHQRYPDHDRDRHSSGGAIESRAVDDDRNSSRRGGAPTIEPKHVNGDSKSLPSIPPPSTIPTAEDTERERERSKKEADSRSSSNGSGAHTASRSRLKKRSQHRSRSSSSSSSSSASSSSSSSKHHEARSKSSSGDDSAASSKSDASGTSKSSKRGKRKSRESRKKSDSATKSSSSSKRTKRRSSDESDSGGGDGGASARKRSTSKSRYHDGGKSSSSSSYKRTASRNDSSAERKRHRRSPSYRRRSPSYHRSGSRREHEHSSKYKDSPSSSSSRSRRRDDYSPESKRSRHRSSSRDSSRYKRR